METADILVVGTGAAGLFNALQLPQSMDVLVITKEEADHSDSFLAQGGMCVLLDEDDYDSYFEDTMKAGHYENNKASVDIMIRSSQHIAQELVDYGVDFQRDGDGCFVFTREGAHSENRILFHEDLTGREITGKLLERAKERKNIRIEEHTTLVDLLCDDKEKRCCGAVVRDADGTISRQILESSQISDPALMAQATHFNPVDLVCATRDVNGKPFHLPDFVDPQTGFISQKSKDGKELLALELPGLWNGAMAKWNTLFVEVPVSTFNPVKTVNDLLRPQHQG